MIGADKSLRNGVRFAVFTDLHYDATPDGLERLTAFIGRAREACVDFIIELGDFCISCDANDPVLLLFNGFEKPHYHVIGNHDTNVYTKNEMVTWLGMDASYYSFECGGVKFIVLDTAFVQYGDEYLNLYKRNHKGAEAIYPAIPDYELSWLEQEINSSTLPVVIFSHHSLENSFGNRGVSNRAAVQAIIRRAESDGKHVPLCINGHDHADSLDKLGNTYYFTLNSMTYKWFGNEYKHFCYSDDLHERYPYLKDIILYDAPLSAIVTIDESGNICIDGMQGGFQKVTPRELGMTASTWDGRGVSANVSSVRLLPLRAYGANTVVNTDAAPLTHATAADIPEILALYGSHFGTAGCTWGEGYPTAENAQADIDANALYKLVWEGRIIAVASVGDFGELAHLSWTPKNACELARIGVLPTLQGRGLGSSVLQQCIAIAKERGHDGMRFLVSRDNASALAMYEKNGFSRCGEAREYDIDFYCYEMTF